MNKVEHIANEIVRGLKVQNGIELEPENALIIARIAISVLEKVHERKVRTAFARWQRFKSEHKAGGKKWLDGLRTCLISRIWLASLCRTTSAQPYGKMIQIF